MLILLFCFWRWLGFLLAEENTLDPALLAFGFLLRSLDLRG
jgi:hypothetical protein